MLLSFIYAASVKRFMSDDLLSLHKRRKISVHSLDQPSLTLVHDKMIGVDSIAG